MPARKKIDLDKVKASLATRCISGRSHDSTDPETVALGEISSFLSLLPSLASTPDGAPSKSRSEQDKSLSAGLQYRAHRGADGPADIECCGNLSPLNLQRLWDFAKQLPCAPSEHGDAGCADGMAFRNESAGGIDATFTIDRGFSVDPILCAFAIRGFS